MYDIMIVVVKKRCAVFDESGNEQVLGGVKNGKMLYL